MGFQQQLDWHGLLFCSAALVTWGWDPTVEGGDEPSYVFQSSPSSSWTPVQRTH